MERLELIIKRARAESLNKEYSTTVGIPQEDFVAWANEAQDRLYSEAIKTHPKYFTAEAIIDSVSGQEAYDLPAHIYLSHIENVEYSIDGTDLNYYRLDQAKLPERISYPVGNPGYYIRRGKQILLVPAPQNGANAKIRITYVKKVPRLEIRRAKIQAVTSTSTQVTALTLTAADLASLDPGGELASYNYLSVVDRDGNLKMAGIEYDSINTGTGVVTLTGGAFTFESGETISTSDYVVIGERSCNRPDLPDMAERYLKEWMTYRAMFRDGSSRAAAKKADCEDILKDTIGAFADIDHDVSAVTILNTDYLDAQRLDIV